ncbi:MAG: hypothetical protein IJ017_06845 [Oscillospiraceae bacterium]|nr:hypothetical protein [Oscillospiraceae bacterium]
MAKKNKEYSPSDKARQFTLGSIARVGACAYLVYIIISLIKGAMSGDAGMPIPVLIIIIAIFTLVGAYLMVAIIKEVIRGIKNKDYSMHKYYEEELTAQGLKYNSKGELVPIDTPDDDDDDEDEETEEEYEEEFEEEYSDEEEESASDEE